jgi:hypothetical protein
MLVAMLDEEPIDPLAAVPIPSHSDEDEAAAEPVALEREFQVALLELPLCAEFPLGLPEAAIPELDGAAAIFSLGDRSFEVSVSEGVIFHLDRKALVVRIERRPLRHCPGFEDAVELEPQIVVQPGGVVLLNDEAQAVRGGHSRIIAGLLRLLEIALGAICL